MIDAFDVNKDGILTREEYIFFIEEVFTLMSGKLHFYKLYFTLMTQPTVWKLFESKFSEVIGPLINTLTDYYKRKGLADPEAESLMVAGLLDGIGFNYIFNPDHYPLDRIRKIIIERFV